ncbi:MAG: superoxide dismutase, partial [Verrucomicrobiota bacterium]
HTFFWNIISPNGGGEPVGALGEAIQKAFGGLEGEKGLKAAFKTAATTRFGSGWAWLVVKADKSIAVTSTPNQDSPLMKGVADVTRLLPQVPEPPPRLRGRLLEGRRLEEGQRALRQGHRLSDSVISVL